MRLYRISAMRAAGFPRLGHGTRLGRGATRLEVSCRRALDGVLLWSAWACRLRLQARLLSPCGNTYL